MAESLAAPTVDPAVLERYWARGSPTAALYAIIDDLRAVYATPAGQRTLDMVVEELGETQENLRAALARLRHRALPPGGESILGELRLLAGAADVDDIRMPRPPEEWEAQLEPVDRAQVGIAVMLGASALAVLGLAVAAMALHITG